MRTNRLWFRSGVVEQTPETRTLGVSIALALLLMYVGLTAAGWQIHWMVHPVARPVATEAAGIAR